MRSTISAASSGRATWVVRYRCDDKGNERVFVTQLAEVGPWPDPQIAAAFELHPVTLSRFRRQARPGGALALLPRKSGPQGPSKMTPQREARCRAWRAQGLSLRAIAERVSRGGRTISHVRVAALFQDHPAPPQQPALPLETVTPPPPEDPPTVADRLRRKSFHPLCGRSAALRGLGTPGLVGRFPASGRRHQALPAVGMAADCGCHRFLFCPALPLSGGLEERPTAGSGRAHRPTPRSLSLRSKVKALAESLDPLSLSRERFCRYLALEPVWEGLYYVDGHFCPYYGQHPTPCGWDAQRRLAVKGHTDVYLHDARGRVLFFFSQPLNDSPGPRPPCRGGRDPPSARPATLHPGLRPRRLQR